MRYCTGAISCHTQFLLGGYSCGHPGLVKEPLSLEMNPPQAAAGIRWRSHYYAVLTAKPTSKETHITELFQLSATQLLILTTVRSIKVGSRTNQETKINLNTSINEPIIKHFKALGFKEFVWFNECISSFEPRCLLELYIY